MALSSLLEPDSEPVAEPELSRVVVVVGSRHVDVGLPSDVSIAALVNEVIDFANAELTAEHGGADGAFDGDSGEWTLARVGGEPLDPNRSLAESDVCDGEILLVREVGKPWAPVLFDDLAVPPSGGRARRVGLVEQVPRVACLAAGLVCSVTAALLVARASLPQAAGAALAVGTSCALAAWVVSRRPQNAAASPWLAAVAVPLIFAGSLHVVSGGRPFDCLPIAFVLIGFVALLTSLVSRRGRSLYTAVIVLSAFGVATTVPVLLWAPPVRSVGALLAITAVIAVYFGPRVTIVLAKLPVPPVPTAGEPLDDIETQGGVTVEGVNAVGKQVIPTEEGLIERVRPSSQYLTGIVVAATVTAVVGCCLAIDVSDGFFWQGAAFAITVATVLCLRGRSHYDLAQSATLIGGGFLIGLALIVKTAAGLDGWRINTALALVVLMALVITCGLIVPGLQFSPVMKRQVEILEYVAIAMLFPLCLWIIRLYAFFRELRL